MLSATTLRRSHPRSSGPAAAGCLAASGFRSTRWISLRRCCRRSPRKRRWSGLPTPAPTPPIPSSKRPSSVSCAVDRKWRGCWSSSTTAKTLAWGGDRACCSPTPFSGAPMRGRGAGDRAIFHERARMRTCTRGGVYSATTHYLKAVEASGTDATAAVMEKMRSAPINDFFVKNGKIREDGRMVHEMYLYEVKKPAESKGIWDYYKLVATIPADQAFQPL